MKKISLIALSPTDSDIHRALAVASPLSVGRPIFQTVLWPQDSFKILITNKPSYLHRSNLNSVQPIAVLVPHLLSPSLVHFLLPLEKQTVTFYVITLCIALSLEFTSE